MFFQAYDANVHLEIVLNAEKMPQNIFHESIQHYVDSTRTLIAKRVTIDEPGDSIVYAQRIRRYNDDVQTLLSEVRWGIAADLLKNATQRAQDVAYASISKGLGALTEPRTEVEHKQIFHGVFLPIKLYEGICADGDVAKTVQAEIDSDLMHQSKILLMVDKRRFGIDWHLQKALRMHERQFHLSLSDENYVQKLHEYLKESNESVEKNYRTTFVSTYMTFSSSLVELTTV